MNEITDTTPEVIRDLAFESQKPAELEPGSFYAWLSNGQVHKIDLTGDQYRDYPKRKAGTVLVRNTASFKHYWDKHHEAASDLFADLDEAEFTAVLDAHGEEPDDVRWGQHRLILRLQQTLPWRTWLKLDRQMMPQQAFAEFLEDNARDVTGGKVSAADLLEIAQSFQAHTKVNFGSAKRLATGETQFTYTEDVTAKAGNRGTIDIPSEFSLGVVPYEDCKPRVLRARFRYRLDGGELRLGYFLDDPARVAREACDEIAAKLAEACSVTVMLGQPSR